jgi:predicted TIM-barrel fold metal-dependent hydrolase
MFNSYLQKIGENDFARVIQVCQYAASKGLILCLDGSYGTSKMYTYDNMRLACLVADAVTSVPIVIVHSGGLRIMKAMLLAMEKKNVWLDTSFSLPYYLGSSIELDYAFTYKKIGTDRVVFGSDIPYLNSEESVKIHMSFFEKYHFSSQAIDNIMCQNARRLFGL